MDCAGEMSIIVKPLQTQHLDDTLVLLAEVFCSQSSLHVAAGIQAPIYRGYLRDMVRCMFSQQLSVGAFEARTDTLVGCLIACDYTVQASYVGTLPQNFRAKAALVKQLEVAYQNHRDVSIGECVLVDMAAVSSSATGLGVYQRLRDAIATRARAAGFRWIVGELSSSSTQYVCIDKLAQTIVTRIFYKDFIYEGDRPFASIIDPEAIVLVEMALG